MINVALVRGAYLNNFEGQNYRFGDTVALHAFSSLHPLHDTFPFPVTRLFSLTDLPVWQKPIKYLSNRLLGDAQLLLGLERYMSSYDIAHTADPHYYYSYQLAVLRRQNKIRRLVTTSWETIPGNNEGTKAKKYIKQKVIEHTDLFICYTDKARETLIKDGADPKKITVIPLGVDFNAFKAKKHKIGNETTYLFVGRLVPEKGIIDLYDAFKSINSNDAKLLIIGDGPLRDTLKDSISRDGLADRVTIQTKPYDAMPSVYQEVDVFVLPSKKTPIWEEQYGMVLIEAMASGLPVVAYSTGAIPEVVGRSGFLIRQDDARTLSGTLRRLTDVQLRDKIGTMGRRRAEERYDAAKTARALIKAYSGLL